MNKFFKLQENNTNVRTEVLAGITTFMTMAYILIVNPNILSAAGMDRTALFTATALAAIVGTVIMALAANYPFALAPGMGLNAFFAYYVVIQLGFSWQIALAAILIEGILFIILTLTKVRESIFNSIPKSLKLAVSAGIGLFIAFIGLQSAGIVVYKEATLVKLGDMTSMTVILTILGILITAILVVKKVRGAILIGILATWIIGMIAEMTGIFSPVFTTIPSGFVSAPPSIAPIFFQFDFSELGNLSFWVVVISFLFVDLFDTLGTLMGVSSKAGYLDKDGKLPKIKEALLADSIATTAGAMFGTSTTTTYIESAAGVADGGRTGLTALTTAALFALALLFSPILLAIPAFATAPALIIVGFYMMESIAKVDFNDLSEAVPAFFAVLIMPLTYSISDGIIFGVVSYTIINMAVGKAKKVHPVMYILTVIFILKYIFI